MTFNFMIINASERNSSSAESLKKEFAVRTAAANQGKSLFNVMTDHPNLEPTIFLTVWANNERDAQSIVTECLSPLTNLTTAEQQYNKFIEIKKSLQTSNTIELGEAGILSYGGPVYLNKK